MLTDFGLALAIGAVIVGTNAVAARTTVPAPVILVVLGSVYAAVPGPTIRISPSVLFDVVIPPLLYAAAIRTSLFGLQRNRGAVASLSVLLVLATTFAVGGAVSAAAGAGGISLGLGAAVVLGAAAASTDPVAALAIARRVGMPAGLTTLLAGEGLLNDAASLTLFAVGIEAVTGHGSAWSATGTFFAAVAGGVGFGLVVGWIVLRARRLLPEPTSHGILSLATPFLAYLPAQALHTSGVLAVVVCGLWLGHHSPAALPGESRLRITSVWDLVEALLQGFVFFLIGAQLSGVVSSIGVYPAAGIGLAVAATVVAVLGTRALWLWLGNRHVAGRVHLSLAVSGSGALGRNEMVVLWWSGSRGVVTLAAAFSIPVTAGGRPFPDRPLLVFCAYVLVLVTLLVQGSTLAPLARALRLPADGAEAHRRLAEARSAAVDAGIRRLEDLLEDDPQAQDVVASLRGRAEQRKERSEDRLASLEDEGEVETRSEVRRRLRAAMIDAEREELLRWRDAGRLPDRDLRVLQRELDYEEGVL